MPVAFTSQVKSVQSQTVMMDSRIENDLRWRERAICKGRELKMSIPETLTLPCRQSYEERVRSFPVGKFWTHLMEADVFLPPVS